MDYLIRRNEEELDSTGYMEIGSGKYVGKHWQHGFLFVWEDAFGMAEGIIAKHFPGYDHFGMNEIPKEIGLKIAEAWSVAAEEFMQVSTGDAAQMLNLAASYRSNLENEIAQHRNAICKMLDELSMEFLHFLKDSDWVLVLGM